MLPTTVTSPATLLTTKVRLPQHVVYRSFPAETVILNLHTGKYHGLNATAGRMLEELERASSVRAAAAVLADDYSQPSETVEQDLCSLCRSLLERGLIEADGAPPD
jgi:hypothetical protein